MSYGASEGSILCDFLFFLGMTHDRLLSMLEKNRRVYNIACNYVVDF